MSEPALMMDIEKLDWDTAFFGLKIGRVEMGQGVTTLSNFDDFDLIYLFRDSELSTEATQILNPQAQIIYQEIKAEYKLKFAANQSIKVVDRIKSVVSGQYESELHHLALVSGTLSRFKRSPGLDQKFEDFYGLWMKKSLSGEMADRVFAFVEQESCLGFVTAKKTDEQTITIGLIAVDEMARGKGVARALLSAVKSYASEQSCSIIMVSTQGDNLAARKLYESYGFTIDSERFLYHISHANTFQ